MAKKPKQPVPNNSFTEILLYTTPSGKVKVEIFLRDENIWLTQEKIAQLFGVDRTVVKKHLKNIFETNELIEDSVCAKIAHTAEDGKTYKTKFYNLDAFLQFNEQEILTDSGKVTAEIAKTFAENEFEKYRVIQDRLYESDFDKEIKKMGNNEK